MWIGHRTAILDLKFRALASCKGEWPTTKGSEEGLTLIINSTDETK